MLLPILLIGNWIAVQVWPTYMEHDLDYLWRHCGPVSKVDPSDLQHHFVVGGGLHGTLYIFNVERDRFTQGDFEAGWRSALTEPFCLVGVRCLIPPETAVQCDPA